MDVTIELRCLIGSDCVADHRLLCLSMSCVSQVRRWSLVRQWGEPMQRIGSTATRSGCIRPKLLQLAARGSEAADRFRRADTTEQWRFDSAAANIRVAMVSAAVNLSCAAATHDNT